MRSRPSKQSTQHESSASLFNAVPRDYRHLRHLMLSQGSPLHETHENYMMINQLQSQSISKPKASLASRLRILRNKMKSISTTFKSDSDWRDTDSNQLISKQTPVKSNKTQSFKIREIKKSLENNRLMSQCNPYESNFYRLRSSQRRSFAVNTHDKQRLICDSFVTKELSANYDQLLYNIGRFSSNLRMDSGLRQSLCSPSRKTQNNSYARNQYIEPTLQSDFNIQKSRNLQPTTKISSFSYSLQHIIGKGSYAMVYQAQDKFGRLVFAVKVYTKSKMASNTRKKIIENEIEVLKLISHENIVKLYKTIEDNAEIHLVLELVKGQSMSNWVKSFSGSSVSEQVAKPYLKKLLNAVAYLHSRNICHRDLKLDNVIITQDSNLKLIDFGFACVESGIPCLGLFCGTPNYMAPEIVNKIPYKGAASDCWAFGVLFYRVIVGSFPFQNLSTAELKKNIISMNFSIPKTVSLDAKKVIEDLLVYSPSERATLQQMKSYKFFI